MLSETLGRHVALEEMADLATTDALVARVRERDPLRVPSDDGVRHWAPQRALCVVSAERDAIVAACADARALLGPGPLWLLPHFGEDHGAVAVDASVFDGRLVDLADECECWYWVFDESATRAAWVDCDNYAHHQPPIWRLEAWRLD